MRLVWCHDIHLDFIGFEPFMKFADTLAAAAPDLLLLGGDISTADRVMKDIECLAERLEIPLYFVLGNHDYYMGSIASIRADAKRLTRSSRYARWLPEAGVVTLSPTTCLIGHDGWGDGRFGNFMASPVMLNDYVQIHELRGLEKKQRQQVLHALGDDAAGWVRDTLEEALASFKNVYFLTHVPPFREACTYEGRLSNDDWLPHFSCKAVGDVLLEVMARHPDRQLTVLAGHTHDGARGQARPNIRWIVGAAEYRDPRIQEVFSI